MRDDVREHLLAALDADHGDALSQAALADWFEETGDLPAGACLRWLVRNRRRPGHHDRATVFGKYFWERQELHPILDDPAAQLPEALWLALANNDEKHPVASFKSYGTPRAAYTALIAGWRTLAEPVADLPARE